MFKTLAVRLAVLLLLVLGTSALFSPSVYLLIKQLFPSISWPYSRIYDRVLLLCCIIFVWLLRKWFFVKGDSISISLKAKTPYIRFFSGVCLSLIPVLIVFPWIADGETFKFKDVTLIALIPKIIKLLPTMLVVGVIEELVFRYFIFLQFRKTMGFVSAAFASSAIYAIVHFVTPVKTFEVTEFSLLSGFEYYLVVFRQLANFDLFLQFGIIFAIGILLCYVLEKTSAITLCMGLHAGWIAAIKLAKFTTDLQVQLPPAANRYALLESPIACLSVMMSFLLVWVVVRRTKFLPREINA